MSTSTSAGVTTMTTTQGSKSGGFLGQILRRAKPDTTYGSLIPLPVKTAAFTTPLTTAAATAILIKTMYQAFLKGTDYSPFPTDDDPSIISYTDDSLSAMQYLPIVPRPAMALTVMANVLSGKNCSYSGIRQALYNIANSLGAKLDVLPAETEAVKFARLTKLIELTDPKDRKDRLTTYSENTSALTLSPTVVPAPPQPPRTAGLPAGSTQFSPANGNAVGGMATAAAAVVAAETARKATAAAETAKKAKAAETFSFEEKCSFAAAAILSLSALGCYLYSRSADPDGSILPSTTWAPHYSGQPASYSSPDWLSRSTLRPGSTWEPFSHGSDSGMRYMRDPIA